MKARRIITDIMLTLGVIGMLLGSAWLFHAHTRHLEYVDIAAGYELQRDEASFTLAAVNRENADAQLYFRGVAAVIVAVSIGILLCSIVLKLEARKKAKLLPQPIALNNPNPPE